ncbi:MAG: 50S ribosomal protein L25 [Thermodesulfobacteriota bacterium]
MDVIELKAGLRDETGKGPAKRLRQTGSLPAVLYGPGIDENLRLTLNSKDLEMILHHTAGGTLLVNLLVDDAKKPRTVMFKDVVRDPVKDNLLHVDLMEVRMDQAVTVEVPLHIVGKSKGEAEGGVVQHDHRVIRGECLPDNIPASIEVDVTELEIGQSIHLKDIKLPEGLKVLDEEDMTIVSVVAPTIQEEEKTAEELEEELAESFEEKDGEAAEEKPEGKKEEKKEESGKE